MSIPGGIGLLDRQIAFQRESTTQDAMGQDVGTWATYSTVWAEVDPTRGNELFRDHQKVDTLLTVFRVRWFDGILATDRISYDGEVYDIRSHMNKGKRKREYIDVMAARIVQEAGQ